MYLLYQLSKASYCIPHLGPGVAELEDHFINFNITYEITVVQKLRHNFRHVRPRESEEPTP